VAHTAITDHRIVRRPGRPPRLPTDAFGGGNPLIHFHRDLMNPNEPGVSRERALAMVEIARGQVGPEIRPLICSRALPLLEQALEADPDDVAAWEGKGYALLQLQRPREALQALEKALEKAPAREVALLEAAVASLSLGRPGAALAYGKRLLAVNPWLPASHLVMARARADREEWPEAIRECRRALHWQPGDIPARKLLISCLVKNGDREEAGRELKRLLALKPPHPDKEREWFDRLTE
jgi:Flp pilus assembly protein TadD